MMLDYQIAVFVFFAGLFLSTLVIGLIESLVKKHKAKKQYFENLIKENKQLKEKIYRLKFNAELRGLKIDD
jgi:hypothetical protein